MNTREIYVVAAARTAIGTFGGALKDVPLSQLATTAVREALKRSGAEAATIGHVVMGNVIPTDAARRLPRARRRRRGRHPARDAGDATSTACAAPACRRSSRRRRRSCSAMPTSRSAAAPSR